MEHVHFLSNSSKIEKIRKSLNLTKSLYVCTLLIGEEHTGKKTFIQTLFPNSIYVNASNEIELHSALENNSELIIYNFESIKNIAKLNFENKRIIAISNTPQTQQRFHDFFAFIYEMPSLKEREDLNELILLFQERIQKELMLKHEMNLEIEKLDLSQNIKSLKASISRQLILKTFQKEEIQELLYNYLFEKLEGNNAYREHLALYEEPLIQAGLKKYKSQLKLAGVLGLNRNTLRKKIQEYDIN